MFNVFEPILVDSLLYAMIEFFNHGFQGTATWSQLSFVPQKVVTTHLLKKTIIYMYIYNVNHKFEKLDEK